MRPWLRQHTGQFLVPGANGLPICDAEGSLVGIVGISAHTSDALGVENAGQVIEDITLEQPSLARCAVSS